MKPRSTVYLSLGSNLGDRWQLLLEAEREISKRVGDIISVSNSYENPPNGFIAEFNFLNNCIKVSTELAPEELLSALKSIESALGRLEKIGDEYTSRCIDIDIILYNSLVYKSERLVIPHPLFRKRRFVLAPLSEIASNEIDPETMLTIQQLLLNCSDKSPMHLID